MLIYNRIRSLSGYFAKNYKGVTIMKKFLSVLIALMMTFSVIGFAFAENEEPDPEPEFVRPVEIAAVDDSGDPIDGVALQLKDADGNVVESWTADGEQILLLPEGEYTLEGLSAPDGYVVESTKPITVERNLQEAGTFIGNYVLNHDHPEICSNPSHAGIELFWVTDSNNNETVTYCFNHGFKNPRDTEYTAYTATKQDLYRYAVNKADGITENDLYNHVMFILLEGPSYLASFVRDDGSSLAPEVQRFLIYMAIKQYTDPKKFPYYDDNGNSTLIRDENGRPMKDENGNYLTNGNGTVLGAMVNHAKGEGNVFPSDYVRAYKYLLHENSNDLPNYGNNHLLYFYYPKGYTITNENSYQILISAKPVEKQDVKIGVHPAERFRVTLKWKDQNNKDGLRPTPEELIPMLHLYLDRTDVTEQYIGGVTVVDNGNNTYSISFANLPKLNKTFSLRFDTIEGYEQNAKSVKDGGTITFAHMKQFKTLPLEPIPIKPVTPPWAKNGQ